MCGGAALRWRKFGGAGKHEFRIGGERVIDRSVRLLSAQFPDWKRYIVSDSLEVEGCDRVPPRQRTYNMDKFTSSSTIWREPGTTLMVYGDVFLSLDAANRIRELANGDKYRWFVNRQAGEVIAFYLPDGLREDANAKFDFLRRTEASGMHYGGGWRSIRYFVGLEPEAPEGEYLLDKIPNDEFCVDISGVTRDFDTPDDLVWWLLPLAEEELKRKGEL
jgi:hypothetical protein